MQNTWRRSSPKLGFPRFHLSSESADEERRSVQRTITVERDPFIFVVDLYNEGVDIPEVNTILFLRPTESMTVFLQQLGGASGSVKEKNVSRCWILSGGRMRIIISMQSTVPCVTDAHVPLAQQIRENTFSLPRDVSSVWRRLPRRPCLRISNSRSPGGRVWFRRLPGLKRSPGRRLLLRNFLTYFDLDPGRSTGSRVSGDLCAEAKLCSNPTPEEEELIQRRRNDYSRSTRFR